MTSPSDNDATGSVEQPANPAIQQVFTAMEAAALSIEEALQISLVLLDFLEGVHLDTLETLLEDEQADGAGIAVWAADSARLKTARELLEQVLGDDDEDGADEAADGTGEAGGAEG